MLYIFVWNPWLFGLLLRLHCIRPQSGINLSTYLFFCMLFLRCILWFTCGKKKRKKGKEDNIDNSFDCLRNQTDITFVEPFRAVTSRCPSKRQKAAVFPFFFMPTIVNLDRTRGAIPKSTKELCVQLIHSAPKINYIHKSSLFYNLIFRTKR